MLIKPPSFCRSPSVVAFSDPARSMRFRRLKRTLPDPSAEMALDEEEWRNASPGAPEVVIEDDDAALGNRGALAIRRDSMIWPDAESC